MKSLPDLCVAIEQGLKCGVYGLQMGLVFKTNPSSPEAAGNIQEPGARRGGGEKAQDLLYPCLRPD